MKNEMWLYDEFYDISCATLKPSHNLSHLQYLQHYYEKYIPVSPCFSEATALTSSLEGYVIIGG